MSVLLWNFEFPWFFKLEKRERALRKFKTDISRCNYNAANFIYNGVKEFYNVVITMTFMKFVPGLLPSGDPISARKLGFGTFEHFCALFQWAIHGHHPALLKRRPFPPPLTPVSRLGYSELGRRAEGQEKPFRSANIKRTLLGLPHNRKRKGGEGRVFFGPKASLYSWNS